MGNRIAVVGSANVDLVAVTRRAPGRGETVTGERFFTATGGKGANQAIAAAKAGGDVAFVGAVGSDAFAADVMAAFTSAGVKTRLVRTVDGPHRHGARRRRRRRGQLDSRRTRGERLGHRVVGRRPGRGA